MSKRTRQYIGIPAALADYYLVHEGAHLLYRQKAKTRGRSLSQRFLLGICSPIRVLAPAVGGFVCGRRFAVDGDVLRAVFKRAAFRSTGRQVGNNSGELAADRTFFHGKSKFSDVEIRIQP